MALKIIHMKIYAFFYEKSTVEFILVKNPLILNDIIFHVPKINNFCIRLMKNIILLNIYKTLHNNHN